MANFLLGCIAGFIIGTIYAAVMLSRREGGWEVRNKFLSGELIEALKEAEPPHFETNRVREELRIAKEEIFRLRDALELISRAEYVNDYDESGKYTGTRYARDIALEALEGQNSS